MPPHCSWSTTGRATALAMSGDESAPLSRAQLMKAVPALVGVVSLGSITAAKSASAALPTAEDYSFGSGSKVRQPLILTGLFFRSVRLFSCPWCKKAVPESWRSCILVARRVYSNCRRINKLSLGLPPDGLVPLLQKIVAATQNTAIF